MILGFLIGGVVGANVGFLAGVAWKAWADARREQDRRLRLIMLGVSASVAAGHGVVKPREPMELLRVCDLQPDRLN